LGLVILTCRFFLHLLPMMLDHTSRGGSQDGVMSGDMADNTANGSAFQASFGSSHAGQQRKTDANGETGSNLAHFLSPGEYR
jgi:hypothetical protein